MSIENNKNSINDSHVYERIEHGRYLFIKVVENLNTHSLSTKNSPGITLAFPLIIESDEDNEEDVKVETSAIANRKKKGKRKEKLQKNKTR
ncbi:37196_t:CDS:2 [Gigaspora margarita]|uniref:37196_t:CDS:1 n=1 Tax=Gigaspora margarita TaxID=4874 RepID=A0ABN7VPJ7_GIGMA|nr:37196_t:CDS:2 [Gigaspora margarita]